MSPTDDRESWLYRSTQDLNSLANLDHEDWDWTDTNPQVILSPATTSSSLCKSPPLKKAPSTAALLAKATTPQTTSIAFAPCTTPTDDPIATTDQLHRPLVPRHWALCSLAANGFLLFTAASVGNQDVRRVLSLGAFPQCTIFVIAQALFGVASFFGGLAGDLASHRMHVVRRSVWLWCIATTVLLVAASPVVSSPEMYIFGLLLAFCSAGGLVSNVMIAGLPSDPSDSVRSHNQVDFAHWFYRRATVHFVMTSLAPSDIHEGAILKGPFDYSALVLTAVLALPTMVGLHLATYLRYLAPTAQLASFGVYLSLLPPIWRGCLLGAVVMVVGALLAFLSLVCHFDTSRRTLAAIGVALILAGWLWTLLWSVAMMKPTGLLRSYFDKSSRSRNEADSTPRRALDNVAPTACIAVFVAFLRGQLYTLYILQACQCESRVLEIAYSPEYTAVVAQIAALITMPLVLRTVLTQMQLARAIFLFLIASFVSGLVELYRRNQGETPLQGLHPQTCHKTATSYNVLWMAPQLILTGVADALFRGTATSVLHAEIPPSLHGAGLGLLPMSDAIGLAASVGLAVALERWFSEAASSDLVLLNLLITAVGCVALSSMKQILIVQSESHRRKETTDES
ncbi:hypothetical protein LEN26_015808 [Aphanomyces euteiches]|nr:hypothetical protein LEN26_015808 [Aphanomyces euteiches]KAH9105121.1 hypothetical protein AeMF1_018977 [Aphanomyces euteiches]